MILPHFAINLDKAGVIEISITAEYSFAIKRGNTWSPIIYLSTKEGTSEVLIFDKSQNIWLSGLAAKYGFKILFVYSLIAKTYKIKFKI